ncbi:peptide-methionine (S)-S-oxide reductase MsrA [soil metagenome]
MTSTRSLPRRATLAAALLFGAGLSGLAFAAAPQTQTAIFAGGCFWTMEHGLEEIPGVTEAVSGYTGGKTAHPTYEDVNTETTGHLEAVRVTYDPAKITYRQLVDRYWRLIDPAQTDGQACDRAPSYHSAIFVNSPQQRKDAEASKAAIDNGKLKGRIATEIRDAAPFWAAEGYHQNYARLHPAQYGAYRVGCGRDGILKAVWGGR